MNNVDIALLNGEYACLGHCPTCDAFVMVNQTHRDGCAHDLALRELGYPTYKERNEARELIRGRT